MNSLCKGILKLLYIKEAFDEDSALLLGEIRRSIIEQRNRMRQALTYLLGNNYICSANISAEQRKSRTVDAKTGSLMYYLTTFGKEYVEEELA